MQPEVITAFEARDDLKKYGDNALLLFALQLKYQIEDIDSVAVNALTDGNDDKKCDLVFVDREKEIAVIAQGYYCSNPNKPTAKANKASDLNTAIAWLFSRPIDELPSRLQTAASDLRDAIESKQITSIQFWFVHNLPESDNVRDELRTVESSAQRMIRSAFPQAEIQEISAVEVGINVLNEWYNALTTPILVTDEFSIPTPYGGFEISEVDWAAYVTVIPVDWLHKTFGSHKDKLFSANIRNYLGSRKSAANINNGIKETASFDPSHFCVYNNGLTILVHEFEPSEDKKTLKVRGLSIVNGAQTTGAIGSLKTPPSARAMVPARFVRCSSQEIVKKIIEFNNKQNLVEPADFRSNDAVQKRLRLEFEKIPGATYYGRRGGADDIIRRPANLIPADTAAQALAAFHGDPILAYNKKSRIWIDNNLYSKYFSERTHAEHIVFVYSLLKGIEAKKRELQDQGDLAEDEQEQLEFLRLRGATYLLTAAIGSCMEALLGRNVPDLFALSFGYQVSPAQAQLYWKPIIDMTIPYSVKMREAIERGLKNADKVKEAIKNFQSNVRSLIAISPLIREALRDFADKVVVRN